MKKATISKLPSVDQVKTYNIRFVHPMIFNGTLLVLTKTVRVVSALSSVTPKAIADNEGFYSKGAYDRKTDAWTFEADKTDFEASSMDELIKELKDIQEVMGLSVEASSLAKLAA